MYKLILLIFSAGLILISCSKEEPKGNSENKADNANGAKQMNSQTEILKSRVDIYAPTAVSVDVSFLSDNDKQVLKLMLDAGKLADEIFWRQKRSEETTS